VDRLPTPEDRLLAHLRRLGYHSALKNSVRHRSLAVLAAGAGLTPEACLRALEGLVTAGLLEVRFDGGGLLDIRLMEAQMGTGSTG
jgi:hypothetical protein